MTRVIAAVLMLAALGACGSRKPLKPVEGMAPVPVARGANRAETPDELMEPSVQARPDRNAELLKQSEERQEDPFDLPPG